MQQLKNIIFDLGGVLLNIDYNKTVAAFEQLGIENFEEMFSQFKANELFENLETGKVNEQEFYAAIKKQIAANITTGQIESAWNAMLLDFRTESLGFLKLLAPDYNLYLLSNTNSIHLKCFQQIFTRDTGKPLLDSFFSKAYYSHLIGLRKPHKEIYEFVLQDADIKKGETIFIDDSANNIEAAKKLGIKTHLLKPNEKIENIGL